MRIKHLDHINLTVRNFDESYDWYRRIFGFELVEQGLRSGHRWGIVKAGEALLCLYENPERKFLDREVLEREGFHGVNHFALRIGDRKAWEARIQQEKIPVQFGGAYRYSHSTSWYVNDPTGYEIEVVEWDGDVVRF